jgi:hypothetical protein
VEASIERGSLMIEKVEKHEWLQDLAEVRRAHQTRDEAMVLTVSTTRMLRTEVRAARVSLTRFIHAPIQF